MSVTLVLGGQWGDEGKAKIVDSLSLQADFIVRFQGGANAGHTVIVGDERYAFHLIPSGILYPKVKCVLGGGMVIDPLGLIDEISELSSRGIDLNGRIFISEQAHVVLPQHILLDKGQEKKKGRNRIGSTGRGITPAYMDKIGREGLRMSVFLKKRKEFSQVIEKRIREKNKNLKILGLRPLPIGKTLEQFLTAKRRISVLICNTRRLLWEQIDKKKRILCEGAQGTLLDIDHGTYPFVTSSNVTAGAAATGSGIPPTSIKRIVGVFKTYCTRVGNGPFPTEEKGKVGEMLREKGWEYGTTTGRPRRCGWFDAVAARSAVKLNGMTEIALTKLDVLDSFPEIKVCTEYKLGSRRIEFLPVDTDELSKCKPVYRVFTGWNSRTSPGSYKSLPLRAREFVKALERLLDCKIKLISLGPERGAIIKVRD